MRNNKIVTLIFLCIISAAFSGCAVVGGIFKAGMGFGIFLVIFVLAVIIYIVSRMRKNS